MPASLSASNLSGATRRACSAAGALSRSIGTRAAALATRACVETPATTLMPFSRWDACAASVPRRGARARHAHRDPPPAAALRIRRGVAEDILAGELVGNLVVDAGQARPVAGKEQPTACLLCERPQGEVRMHRIAARRRR